MKTFIQAGSCPGVFAMDKRAVARLGEREVILHKINFGEK